MIRLVNLSKSFFVNGQQTIVADEINVSFPIRASVALLGRNGAGKSSLLKMIAGTMDPSSGEIFSTGTISWPVGFAGNFHPDLSGAQNTRFIARLYGVDTDELLEFVKDFAELGNKFDLPFGSYSSGMRSRLAFGVSMGVDFDTYLVDEVTSVGDAAFRQKSSRVFKDRGKTRGGIVVSHSMPVLRDLCDAGAILENGKLSYFDNLDEAIKVHHENMAVAL